MKKKIITMALMSLVATMGNSIAFANIPIEENPIPPTLPVCGQMECDMSRAHTSLSPALFSHYVDKKLEFAKRIASKQIIFEQDQKAENFINAIDKDEIKIGATEIIYTSHSVPDFGASVSRTDCENNANKIKITEDLYMFVVAHDAKVKYINATYRDPVTNFIVHKKINNIFGTYNVPQEKDFVKIVNAKYNDAYKMPLYVSLEFVNHKGHSSYALVRYNVAFDKNELELIDTFSSKPIIKKK